MYKMRTITAAEAGDIDPLDEMMKQLKDDFDFAISGIEKLSRSGAQSANDALVTGEKLLNAINDVITEIAGNIEEE